MSEPTIEEVIKRLEGHKISGFELTDEQCDLAMRALEEMREKKDYCLHCPLSPIFPGKVVYEDHICLKLPTPKRRTWRDVTAGEMIDIITKQYTKERGYLGSEVQTLVGIEKWSAIAIERLTNKNPLGHGPRLGTEFPEEK